MEQETGPRVTVVIPTNRTGHFLPEALDSVTAQTYRSFEVIVAANSTADVNGLQRIVDRYPKTRLVYQPTTGPVLSRNLGTALARGEYIAFLDDDDVWHPDRLRLQVTQLDLQPGAVLCYAAGWTIDHTGATVGTSWLPTGVANTDLLCGRVDIPRIVTMLFRRTELIRIGGFHPSFRFAEDDELILRALQFGEVTSVPQALVGYRRHEGNVTGADVERRRLSSRRVITLQRWGADAWDDPGWAAAMAENDERYRRRTADEQTGDALRSLKRGEVAVGLTTLYHAVRTSPWRAAGGVVVRVCAKLAGPKATRPGAAPPRRDPAADAPAGYATEPGSARRT